MAKTKTNNKKDPKKKHRPGTISKKNTGGRKLVSRYQSHPQFRCVLRHIDVWFAGKIHTLSMNHLPVHMRFPTMWYERPAKPQISLRIHAV